MSITTSQRISRHVLEDPPSGLVVDAEVGSCVQLIFRRRAGTSRWQVADRPAHVVPIEETGHEFVFLLFPPARGDSSVLRLVRRRTGASDSSEVRDLTLTVTG